MFMFYIYKSDSIFNCETQTIQHFEKWTNDKIFSLEKIIEHQVKILIYRQYGMIWNLQANKLSCWIQKLQQNKPKKNDSGWPCCKAWKTECVRIWGTEWGQSSIIDMLPFLYTLSFSMIQFISHKLCLVHVCN